MNILYIALMHVNWRFRICNYFCEISKFRDFRNTLRNFAKSVWLIFPRNLNISRNKRNLQIMCFKMIYNMFIFYESEIFSGATTELLRSHFAKIAHKVAKSKYFVDV